MPGLRQTANDSARLRKVSNPMVTENIEKALKALFGDEPTQQLARILLHLSRTGVVSYDEARRTANGDPDDALISAFALRLLVPLRSVKGTLAWDDGVFLLRPGERYKMPNVVRYLVDEAVTTGDWNPPKAIGQVLGDMGEPQWRRMPDIVNRLGEEASANIIDADTVRRVCRESGLGKQVDSLIAALKGAGVMSPRLGAMGEVHRAGSPLYELNPSLFPTPQKS